MGFINNTVNTHAIKAKNIYKHFNRKSYSLNNIFNFLNNKNKPTHTEYSLSNISFSVPKKSTLGIIGKNGSGKSTLLRILAKITAPTSGSVCTIGRIAAIIDIGSGFHPELSGRENIRFYGKLLGMTDSNIKEMYDTIVDFSEIGDHIDEPVKYYSSGMYLRLAFSIAVHSDVEIILFDEVLTVGDNNFNIKCFEKINELKKTKTMVLVSHNMEDIVRVSDQCIWLDNGHIKAIGAPHAVVNSYIEDGWLKKNAKINHTNHYLFNFSPTHEEFQIHQIKINGLSGKDFIGGIEYNEDFSLSIVIEANRKVTNTAIPTILFTDQMNNNIITTSSIFSGNSELVINKNGIYHLECTFPKQFLNESTYRISFLIIDEQDHILFHQSDLALFKIVVHNKEQKLYLKKTSNSLAPALNWNIKVISSQNHSALSFNS